MSWFSLQAPHLSLFAWGIVLGRSFLGAPLILGFFLSSFGLDGLGAGGGFGLWRELLDCGLS